MKRLFFILFLSLMQNVSHAVETPEKNGTTIQDIDQSKAPDFSPPKDLSGPVFPLEDLIGKPNQETNRFLDEFVSMMATLGLIISLILVIAWFLKRMLNTRQEQANTTSIIKVIERRSLSPKSAIYLLEIEGKSIIIAESMNGIVRLADYDTPDEKEEAPASISAFNKLLEQTEK